MCVAAVEPAEPTTTANLVVDRDDSVVVVVLNIDDKVLIIFSTKISLLDDSIQSIC